MSRTIAAITVLSAVCLSALAGCSGEGAPAPTADPQEQDGELNSGPVTLHVPILEELRVGKATRRKLIAERNADLKKAGLEEFPEFVTVDAKNAGAPFSALRDRADVASEKLKLKNGIELISFGDGSELTGRFGKNKQGLCYTGDPKKALALFLSLTDVVFSDQFTLKAWRHKLKAFDFENAPFEGSEAQADEANYPDVWKEWRGKGDAILLISSTSDGGEENSPTILPRCR